MDPAFRLPRPVPEDALLVCPPAWTDPGGEDLETCDPAAALKRLGAEADPERDPARLIFVHQDAFAGDDGTDRLARWLEVLVDLRRPYLPILLHGNLPGEDLVRFFRAGLFDALSLPVSHAAWVNMLIRAEKKLELGHQSRLILASSGRTQEMLRAMRRQLGGETARTTRELLRAQESLEAANRQLTDAMGELSLLYRFGRELSTARNWDKVLREMLENLAGFVGSGGAALILRSAPGGSFSPRQTWHWNEGSWDQVLVSLQDQVDAAVAESIMAPGVFRLDPEDHAGDDTPRRVIALPLEHSDLRLGYLLLLFKTPEAREVASGRFLPFLQAVQVVLSEEVASAQLLDRIRDIGTFNARVLDTVSSAIWVLDEDGRTVYCNGAGQRLLTGREPQGMGAEEFIFQIGRGRGSLTGADGHLPELLLDARLELDGIPGLLLPLLRDPDREAFRGEGQVKRTDGEGIPVLLQSSLMPGRSSGEHWLVVVAEDLRDSRRLEAERLRSDRLEGLVEMSATLAHEIRNPLMGLSAQAELLADHLSAEDPRARYIEVICAEVDRINETITRMLQFVRPYEPDLNETSVLALMRDSLDLVRSRAAARDVDLDLSLADGVQPEQWLLRLDGGQIKQVLLNLLINAVDAAPAGGRVEARLAASERLDLVNAARGTRTASPGLICEVWDDGPGFADQDTAKLFRPFYTTKSSGTGLGLSISHKIVAAHGGEITAGRQDDRTVFRIRLPRAAAAAGTDVQRQEEAE